MFFIANPSFSMHYDPKYFSLPDQDSKAHNIAFDYINDHIQLVETFLILSWINGHSN